MKIKILLSIVAFYTLLVFLCLSNKSVSVAFAQSDSCTDGQSLVIDTVNKRYKCLTITSGGLGSGGNVNMTIANASSTGTTVNRLAKLTGAPSTALITSTSDTENAIGIVTSGAGTTGSAVIAILGQVNCDFDNATVAGDYVVISAITAGKCHDNGSTFPNDKAAYGRVLSTNGSSGTYSMELMTPDIAFQNAGSGKSKPGGNSTQFQFNNSGVFAGSAALISNGVSSPSIQITGLANGTVPLFVTLFNNTSGPAASFRNSTAAVKIDIDVQDSGGIGTPRLVATGGSGNGQFRINMAGVGYDALILGDFISLNSNADNASAGSPINLNTRQTLNQNHNILSIQNNSTNLWTIRGDGGVTWTQGTLTSNDPFISHTVEWNQGGTTFQGLVSNVTDSASAATSTLLDFQVGSASKFKIIKTGTLQLAASQIYSVGTPAIAGNATLNTNSKDSAGKITSTATGASTAVLTFATAFTNAPACVVTNETTSNLVRPISTTTTLTINATVVTGDSISYICTGY